MTEEIARVDEKVLEIELHAARLRSQIEEFKAWSQKQREDNQRRREDIRAAKASVQTPRTRALEVVHVAVKKSRYRLEKVHKRTADAREYLCREASSLSGLLKVRSKEGRIEYRLSGGPIPDLTELNGTTKKVAFDTILTPSGPKSISEPYEIISASFINLCRFLAICTHYLSIRLPAEIILPHSDLPHAVILPRDSSYRSPQTRYPGAGTSKSSSPASSKVLQRAELSRPRLLQLDRPLAQLQKEDPKTALLFLEGAVLLAYNIAWLCRSQGIGNVTTFPEISAIGANLHRLFLGEGKLTQRPPLNRNISATTTATNQTTASAQQWTLHLGGASHASAQHCLSGHLGTTLVSSEAWPVSITKLTDHLRSHLRRESARAEWDIVDVETEWNEAEQEKGVFVGGVPDLGMSVLSVRPSDGMDEGNGGFGQRPSERRVNGWMKVRDRAVDEAGD